MRFIFKMAWRDSRMSRRRLLLLSLSIVLGIGALVAIGSVSANLRQAINEQANSLLGADIVIAGTIPTSPEWQQALEATHGEIARERVAGTPLVSGGFMRRVQLRAIEGNFPFYGDFITVPADAPARLRQGGHVIILDEAVLDQFKVRVGDTVIVGNEKVPFTVIGALKAFPGEPPVFATIQPRAFIPLSAKTGGAINRVNLKLPLGSDVAAIVQGLKAKFSDDRLFFSTAEERHRDMERSLTGVDAFFRLVGFVALFLGAIGVASVVHVYVRQKITTVAVLRCLGASAGQTFSIYLLQGLAVGLFGSVIGALVGVAAQWALPLMLKDIIPLKIHFFVSWLAISSGMVSGLVICLLFTLLPLLAVRRVPPLAAFRSALAEQAGLAFDLWRVVIGVLIPVAVAGFAMWQTNDVKVGVGYAAALGVGFTLLAGTAKLVSKAAQAWSPRRLPYVVRQGIANLHRPNNRTVLLLVSLGLGAFLMIALYLVRTELLLQIEGPEGATRPNLLFRRVDEDQMDSVAKLAAAQGAPVVMKTPWVNITLLKINGLPPGRTWRERFGQRQQDGKLLVNLTATYRDHLLANETVMEGKFVPRVEPGTAVVPVTIPAWMARGRNSVAQVGDRLDFDVQGIPIHTRVVAVRLITGMFLTQNFNVLFPEGVIDGAPKYYEAGAHAPTSAIATQVQQAVYAAYPEIQVTDLVVLVQAIEHIFRKIAFVIGFMASFIVATGVIMLVSAILTGRFQRIRETVLLRTLGASHRQLVFIQLVEYAILGVMASLVGTLLAVGGNLLLAHFVFKITPVTPPLLLLGAMAAVTAITLITGWIANRGVTDYPPLAVLRQET